MKLAFLVFVFAVTAAGQASQNCDLTDARTFFVTHRDSTSSPERKKIDKALRQSGGLKQADRPDRADIEIDLTQPDWLTVWHRTAGERMIVDRIPLAEGYATATLPGSIRTTTVHTRSVTTSNTTINPPRAVAVRVSPEIDTAGEYLFQLKARRQMCQKAH
jgi:hypothetical protein